MGAGKKKQTVGYSYGLTVHMGVCYGPVDRVVRVLADDREAYTDVITDTSLININKPELFGGNKKEGGLVGTMHIQMGKDDQLPSSLLTAHLGNQIPAFRGILGFIYRGIMSVNNPYLKPFSYIVRRVVSGWYNNNVWYSAKALIDDHDANPAHIVYECLTNPHWGMGYPTSAIDDVSFRSAADQLYSEGFGLSLLWNQQNNIDAFLGIIFNYINGSLQLDPKTGLLQIKLIRDDNDIDDLPVFDPSNVVDVISFQRAGWGELVNEITLKYTDRSTYKETAVTVQNLATIQAQGGVINQTLDYSGITSANLSQRVANRELISRSSPLAKAELLINREAWSLLPGGAFKLVWPKLGITGVIMRVGGLSLGSIDDGKIKVQAVEDVFGLPDSVYSEQESGGWVDPIQPPQPSPHRLFIESTWYDLASTLTPADLSFVDSTDGYPLMFASKSGAAAYNYSLLTAIGGSSNFREVDQAGYCPVGIIINILVKEEHSDIEISIDQPDKIIVGEYAIIDDEYVRIDAFNATTNILTIARGVIDTVPVEHLGGSIIYFADSDGSNDPNAWVEGSTVDAKVITRTGAGELDPSLAPIDSLAIAARQNKPYPPALFRINTEYLPDSVEGPVTVSWAHRNRLLQDIQILAQDEAGVSPEAGTTYTIKIYDEDDVLCRTLTGITSNSYTYPLDDELADCVGMQNHLRVELFSVRDGVESWQMHSHRFERVYSGYGFNYGVAWGV